MSTTETKVTLENGSNSLQPPIAPTFNDQENQEDDTLVQLLKEKRKQLDGTFQEIQAIEKTLYSPAKSPSSRTKSTTPLQDDLYTRVLALEKELKVKDDEVETILHEKKALEKITKKQNEATLQLTQELTATKQHVLQLQYDLQLKTEEDKSLFTEKRMAYDHNVANSNAVKHLEEENRKQGKGAYPQDLYFEMMKFENEVVDRDRVINELKAENKTLEKMLQQREEDYLLLHQEFTETKQAENHHQIVLLENKIRELSSIQNIIVELQEENKMLVTIQNAKTEAIEELTKELSVRGATDEYVEQLKRELKVKDKEIYDWKDENSKLLRVAAQREELIARLKKEELGIPYNLWQEERKLLKSEMKILQENKAANERIIAKQKDRIRQLNDRIDVVTKTLQSTGSPLKIQRKQPSTAANSRKKSLTSPSPTKTRIMSATSTPLSPVQDLNSSFESMDLNNSELLGEVKNDSVPAAMFDALQGAVDKLRSSVSAKENALEEKDEIIQMLAKKAEIEAKARSSEEKQWKKRELDLKDQIEALKRRLEFIEDEHRERDQELYTLKTTQQFSLQSPQKDTLKNS